MQKIKQKKKSLGTAVLAEALASFFAGCGVVG